MSRPTAQPSTWFVTGTSRGLGLELVRALLDRGHNVAATTRSPERLLAALDGADRTRLLPLALDLGDGAAVERAVKQTAAHFGGLDVVVNNAGYGYLAAVEETPDADARALFDVQVFGLWNVLRAALPVLREQRAGHIVNISSILGLTAFPGWGLYCAAKFAVEGLSESLAAEVAEHGIRVTLVEPGYFRTDFLTTDSLALPATTVDAYPAIRQMTGDHLALQGSQLGDPVKGAAAIIAAVERGGRGRLRQLLGSDSDGLARTKVETLLGDLDAGRELAYSTDFAG
jgi:NAD(P)-dependent dehydrogenase (short-subunit alcohol dehydrogenase family)